MWLGKFLFYKDVNYEISTTQCWIMIDYYKSYLYTADTLIELFVLILKEWRLDRHLLG